MVVINFCMRRKRADIQDYEMFKILIKIIVREHLACLLLVYHWASYSSFWSFSLGQDLKRGKPWWAPDNVTMSPFLMDPEIFLHTVQTKWIFINNFFCWDWSEVLHTWNFNVHIGLQYMYGVDIPEDFADPEGLLHQADFFMMEPIQAYSQLWVSSLPIPWVWRLSRSW